MMVDQESRKQVDLLRWRIGTAIGLVIFLALQVLNVMHDREDTREIVAVNRQTKANAQAIDELRRLTEQFKTDHHAMRMALEENTKLLVQLNKSKTARPK